MAVSHIAAATELRSALRSRVIKMFRQVCREVPRIIVMLVQTSCLYEKPFYSLNSYTLPLNFQRLLL